MNKDELTGVAQQPCDLEVQQETAQRLVNIFELHTISLRNLHATNELQQKEIEQLEARLGNLERRV